MLIGVSNLEQSKKVDGAKIGKTRIMYLCNLSFTQVNEYVNLCLKNELIQKSENGDFHVPPKGYKFMEDYQSLKTLSGDASPSLSLININAQITVIGKNHQKK
jgi:predicted transcriptional regulator